VFLAPSLYRTNQNGRTAGQNVCRDIVTGDNRSPQPGVGYEAGPGFDAVSGWGVPAGSPLQAGRAAAAAASAPAG
jgi:kumamolisin